MCTLDWILFCAIKQALGYKQHGAFLMTMCGLELNSMSLPSSAQANKLPGNGFNVFIWSQLECQLLLIFASLPFFHRCFSQNPNLPIVYVYPATKERNDSVISRVSSSLSGQIKRIPLGRGKSVRDVGISRPRPQAVEIPEWEFQTLETPQADRSPVDEHTYDRYLAGMYGPPAPPKDSRRLFDQYRREHGEVL